MWYKFSKIKSLPSGQLYFEDNNQSEKINPEEYFDIIFDYNNSTDIPNYPKSKDQFDIDLHYPDEFNMDARAHILTITAINKKNSEPAAQMKIIFPFSHQDAAIIDDISVYGKKGYQQLLKSWGKELSKDEMTYAKNGLGQFLYTKATQWMQENKPEVKFVTGYISSKEAYKSRIKALGKPSYIRPRSIFQPIDISDEQIINYLDPAHFSQQGGSYTYDNQVEVRHKIKDSTNIDPSNDKS
jgi:hypothetical protein